MTTFLLIRHGFTDVIGHTIVGWSPGVHLNERGRAQAHQLAEELAESPIDAMYVSPLERARETAEPIAARLGLTPKILESIGEVRTGEWTGMSLDELNSDQRWRNWNMYRSGSRAPGGETMLDVQVRFVDEMNRLRALHPDQTIALVSHADPIRAALVHFLGMSLDLCLRIEISPASVSIVRLEDWGVHVVAMGLRADGFKVLAG